MIEEAGVIDTPEVEAEPIESAVEPVEQTEPADNDSGPYTTRSSREFRAATKAWEQAHPEAAKYAKQARDNHGRLFELNQIEPKGIEGVRERYALLNSLVMGEQKGPEALTAMQERAAAVQETDSYLASGDPRALEAFGEEFNEGLAKLAPAYLERVMKANPEAYAAAVLPHFVRELGSSDLVKSFNDLVDVLNAQNDPRFDEKTKLQFTMTQIAKMGAWFNAQQEKAGKLGPVQAANTQTPPNDERTAFEKERQDFHWDSKIKPGIVAHENKTFEDLFAPYQRRLKLDDNAKNALMSDFKADLSKAGNSDQAYISQMKMFRRQGTPDPAAVQNFVKNAINRHGKSVLESIVTARYGRFLTAQPKTTPVTQGAKIPPAEPSVEIRSVMPPRDQINFVRTPPNWMASTYPGGKKYYLNNGKVIQVRPTS